MVYDIETTSEIWNPDDLIAMLREGAAETLSAYIDEMSYRSRERSPYANDFVEGAARMLTAARQLEHSHVTHTQLLPEGGRALPNGLKF